MAKDGTAEIERKMKDAKAFDRCYYDIVMLGPASSGKSIIFKQFQQCYAKSQIHGQSSEDKHLVHHKSVQTFAYEAIPDYRFQFHLIASSFNSQIPKKLWILDQWERASPCTLSIVYIADLSKYWRCSRDGRNALEQDIEFFADIINSKFTNQRYEIFLIFNKKDIFRQQLITRIPFAEFSNEKWRNMLGNEEFRLLSHSLCNISFIQAISVCGFIRTSCLNHIVPDEVIEIIKGFILKDISFPRRSLLFDELYDCALKFVSELFLSVNQTEARMIFFYELCGMEIDDVQKTFWDIHGSIYLTNRKVS